MNNIPYKNIFYEKYKKNVFSQNGEDGVLEELLKRLNINNGYVCEFGAWDGKHLSNTFLLVTKGFNAVYIESDKEKYKDLLETAKEYKNIFPICEFVDWKPNSTDLDSILSRTTIPIDFDVLSIDIDSYDYQIWKSLKRYRPKIIIIEINSGANPEDINHIHNKDQKNTYQGTSFSAMLNLGKEKGYTFVVHTGNMFFIRSDLFPRINMFEPKILYNNPIENFRRIWLN